MSYESPISVILDEVSSRIKEAEEDQILRVVQSVGVKVDKEELIKALEYDRDQYERGRWDMFQTISSLFYGKQCYFLERDGSVYSRASGKYMTKEEAYEEFLI